MADDTTIFGREPAFWIGLIEAILAFVLSLDLFSLSQDTLGIIMAVVTAAFGFYTAYVTHQTLLGVGVGLAKALIALLVVFNLNVSVDTSATLIALVTIALGAFNRTQATPALKSQRGFQLTA